MAPTDRPPIPGARNGQKKWTDDEHRAMHIIFSEFVINNESGLSKADVFNLFVRVFPDKAPYSYTHIKDRWQGRFSDNKPKVWQDIDRPNPKNENSAAHTQADLREFVRIRTMLETAARAMGLQLPRVQPPPPCAQLPGAVAAPAPALIAPTAPAAIVPTPAMPPHNTNNQAQQAPVNGDNEDEDDGEQTGDTIDKGEGGQVQDAERTMSQGQVQQPPSSALSSAPMNLTTLPMIHKCDLLTANIVQGYHIFRSFRGEYGIRTTDREDTTIDEDGFIKTDSPIYQHGGPAMRVQNIDGSFDTMVCNSSICTVCSDNRPKSPASQSPTAGLPFVHTLRDCRPPEDDASLHFSPPIMVEYSNIIGPTKKCFVHFTTADDVKTSEAACCIPEECNVCKDKVGKIRIESGRVRIWRAPEEHAAIQEGWKRYREDQIRRGVRSKVDGLTNYERQKKRENEESELEDSQSKDT